MSLSINVDMLIHLARDIFTSAVAKADENAAQEGSDFIKYIVAYPRLGPLGQAVLKAAEANGWTKSLNEQGHTIVTPPPIDAGGRPSGANRGGLMPPGV